ncbi:TAXI family TRAP transporter solute-binding subunit [Rivibacter subsaxonicus]|uniref:TRAP-type uncharacterized transport system substrate-binding protein n=1 Tax=Rivibacter subsaxonicus TaxID=457575 RepID=A0A4Q7W1L1_9BURK|nr:TAXI family TRAP transporter solute-binding subunit [Rivibacter subsaxonicus]RZU02903.1 TRAP-type uncharacterized transport system substrate-binding protein [Rivibacter subsaxonicus]
MNTEAAPDPTASADTDEAPPGDGGDASSRPLLATSAAFLLLGLLLVLLAYWLLDPRPPRQVTLATGPEQGAYAAFGEQYREQLRRQRIEVTLRPSAGAAENLKLLEDPDSGVDFAFVQGGADRLRQPDEPLPEDLVALGSLFYEPVWLFYRTDSAKRLLGRPQLHGMAELKNWRLNVGAPGSGAANLALRLLDASGLEPQQLTLAQLPPTPAVVALIDGEIDALLFVSAPESPLVRMLLQTPGVGLLDFVQAEAYTRRVPVLSSVTLPRGVIDLAQDLPPQDVHLVAPTAMMVARESSHPALQQLFVQAARRIHGEAGWFQRRGEFPTPRNVEFTLSKEAERFYQSGPPMLQRHLPFGVANLVDRMWVVLASIIVVLIPLSRVIPPLYELRVRSKVFRWYGRLRQIEARLAAERSVDVARLRRELDALDARVDRVKVPLAYADELYALRGHIQLVRKRLIALGGARPEAPAA